MPLSKIDALGLTDPAKPANGVTTGSGTELAALNRNLNPENLPKGKSKPEDSKPAIEVITGFGVELRDPGGAKAFPSLSACEPFQEVIQLGLSRGRNARAICQDLVSDHGFRAGYQSVRRFIYKLRGSQTPQARAVIVKDIAPRVYFSSNKNDFLLDNAHPSGA